MTSASYPAGSLDLEGIKKTLFQVFRDRVSGLVPASQIIWRNQSEPLPPRPCITMRITSGPTRGGYSDGETFVGGTSGSQFVYSGHREMVVSVQIFGSTKVHRPMAYQLAFDLCSSLNLPTVLQQLRAGGISVLLQGDPNNLTALEETEFEERAQFDMTLGLAQNLVDDPGIIEHIGPITQNITKA